MESSLLARCHKLCKLKKNLVDWLVCRRWSSVTLERQWTGWWRRWQLRDMQLLSYLGSSLLRSALLFWTGRLTMCINKLSDLIIVSSLHLHTCLLKAPQKCVEIDSEMGWRRSSSQQTSSPGELTLSRFSKCNLNIQRSLVWGGQHLLYLWLAIVHLMPGDHCCELWPASGCQWQSRLWDLFAQDR